MLGEDVKRKARELGFDLAGIASAADPMLAQALARYTSWLDRGFVATMEYLRRHAEIKAHPEKLLEGCRSIICVGALYGTPPPPENPRRAKVSLYTRGGDYHESMSRRLVELAEWLEREHGARSRAFVDSEPVLERFWAWRAGLGWIGKNAMLINRKVGSYFFIGGLLTTVELEPDQPGIDHCGKCRKCIEACPTQAITGERSIESARCIAYHTIENRGPVPLDVMKGTGTWIAGCDICQSVCPWNDPLTPAAGFGQSNPAFDAELVELAGWTSAQFKERTRGIAMARMKYSGFLRNVTIAVAGSRLSRDEKIEALERIGRSAEELAEGAGRSGVLSALAWAKGDL